MPDLTREQVLGALLDTTEPDVIRLSAAWLVKGADAVLALLAEAPSPHGRLRDEAEARELALFQRAEAAEQRAEVAERRLAELVEAPQPRVMWRGPVDELRDGASRIVLGTSTRVVVIEEVAG